MPSRRSSVSLLISLWDSRLPDGPSRRSSLLEKDIPQDCGQQACHAVSHVNRLAALALKPESGDRRRRSIGISLLLFLGLSGISIIRVLGSHVGSEPLVLLLDLRELPHVLEEVRTALECDQELGLLAAFGALILTLTLARDRDGHRANRFELGVLVPIANKKATRLNKMRAQKFVENQRKL